MRRLLSLILLSFLLFSFVPMLHLASASGSFTPPSNLTMGSFVADPEVAGGNAAGLSEWFSMSWGINQAYQVGAVDHPYQFLYGDFFQNGQQVVQPVQVEFTINWTVVRNNLAVVNDGSWTKLGAPQWGAFATGLIDNLYNYPIHVFYIQNATVLEYNITTAQGQNKYTVPSFYPVSAANGSFYIVVQAEYATHNFGEAGYGQVGYRTIYVGEGEFNAINSHVLGKPTIVVNSQLVGASAFLNWSFSAGEWNATFVHYLNNNPGDTSPSNIQTLQYYNFTYAETGGIVHLRYNFSSSSPSGVYGWRMHEGVTDYGTSFIVYNNATSVSSGDKPPMVSIWIKTKVAQGSTETITVLADDLKSSSIDLMVSVWFGNDLYTVPNPSYSNVIYYFAPYNVTSGQNISISFVATFYGEINVEVVSHNAFNQWNNSYASSVVKSNIYDNGSFQLPGPSQSWFTSPLSSILNALFLFAGIVLLIYSIHESGLEGAERKRIMQGFSAPFLDFRTHYLAAILLLMLSFVNWSYIFTAITSWGGGIP